MTEEMPEYRSPNQQNEEALPFKEIGGWGFYRSTADHSIHIKTSDYHPTPLRVTKEDLLELLAVIEQAHEETEKGIIDELEGHCHLQSHIIESIGKDPRREIFRRARIRLEIEE